MTIDEAIKHCLKVAEKNEISAITYKNCKENKTNMYEKLTAEKAENECRECAANHRQLAEWLKDYKELKNSIGAVKLELLKEAQAELEKRGNMLHDAVAELEEAKRLLKSAVEDINWINEHTQDEDGSCIMRTNSGCSGCPLDINGDLFCKWKHNDEALKLIEKGENDEG